MLFHIDPLRLWVHKVLPVVYDDSLSYYEVLAKVTKKLNEVIDLTEEQNQYIEEFSTNLTNAINHWEDGMEQEWSSYKSGLNNEWGAFQRNTEQYIENWKNMAESDIEDAIAAGINQFVSYFSDLTQTAVDAAERAMEAADTAAQDAVEAVMPTLESEFDERYAWKTAVGSPLVATTAAGMTDTTKVYVYAGSESGYVSGDWYYYDGTAWQDGGVYNSAAVVTDPTLSESGVPADAKAAGDEIADLKSAITDGNTPINLNLTIDPSTRFYSRIIRKSEEIYPLTFRCTDQAYSFYLSYYKADSTFVSNSGWQKGTYTITTSSFPAEAVSCVMTCKADNEHPLSDAEKALFSASYVLPIFKDVETIQQKLKIYYVSTTGNDGNAGTKASPFKTITKALNTNARKIFVTPGTYSERLNLYGLSDIVIGPLYSGFSTSDYSAKIVLDGITTRPYLIDLQDSTNITLIGIKAINYTNSGFKITNCTNIHCFNCEAGNQSGSYQYGMGFEVVKTDAEFNDCVAHDVVLDGFNVHDYGGVIFNNCIAYNCGDDGVSHHDACIGYIFGGEYYNCGKGGIASPTHGAYVDVVSAYSHDNAYGLYTGNTAGRRNCKAKITNCVFKNNSSADVLISGTDAVGWNNLYDTKSIASGSTFTEIN